MRVQASDSVKHLMLPCHHSQHNAVAPDLVRCYAAMGRAIIFTDTKRECDELAGTLSQALTAKPLHGDIPQHQREVGLCVQPCAHLDPSLCATVAPRPYSYGQRLRLETQLLHALLQQQQGLSFC